LSSAGRKKPQAARAEKRRPRAKGTSSPKGPPPGERTPLSREAILRAALEIADRDGLGGLTMRKIAGRLGASPMGVYRHFRNKAEIVGLLVDLVIGDYDVTNHQEKTWTEWVRESFLQMKRALCAHPGIIPLLGAAGFSGANALGVVERVLDVLRSAGLGDGSAPLFHTLMSYTIGAVAIESSAFSQTGGEEESSLDEQLRRTQILLELAPRSSYPNVVASAPQLARFVTDESFVAGLDRILSAVSMK
jgi:TetR/AcrR family tetracycline transcriptional repressor